MRRQTAINAKPLSRAEAKAGVAALVKEGKITPSQAKLFDFDRELSDRERAHAETLVTAARRALERSSRQAV